MRSKRTRTACSAYFQLRISIKLKTRTGLWQADDEKLLRLSAIGILAVRAAIQDGTARKPKLDWWFTASTYGTSIRICQELHNNSREASETVDSTLLDDVWSH